MLLGSHVSTDGKRMLLGSAEKVASHGSTTFTIYIGAPQDTRRKPIEETNIETGQAFMKEHNLSNIVIHAPYIINLGSTVKTENFGFAIDFLRQEVKRAQALGATQIILHPGAHVDAGPEAGIRQVVKGLNEVLWGEQVPQIALETMAGKGTEVNRMSDRLAATIDGVMLSDKLSIILDTCHINDTSHNTEDDFNGTLVEFDKIIGLDCLKAIHMDNLKNPVSSHRGHHANISFGTISSEVLNGMVHHEGLTALLKILEASYVGENKKNRKAPYDFETTILKNQAFDPELLGKIQGQN